MYSKAGMELLLREVRCLEDEGVTEEKALAKALGLPKRCMPIPAFVLSLKFRRDGVARGVNARRHPL